MSGLVLPLAAYLETDDLRRIDATTRANSELRGAAGGWETAFQSNDNQLWVVGADNRRPLAFGMAAGTSPSITSY